MEPLIQRVPPATDSVIQAFLSGATAIDSVDGDLTASITHDAPVQFPLGATIVTFSATDSASNPGTAQATVSIVDQTAPVLTVPGNGTVAAVDSSGTPATDPTIQGFLSGATANDNVDGSLTASITHDAPAQFLLGTTIVTFSATDGANNPGTAQASVTIVDQTAPVVTVPGNVTVAAVDNTGTPSTDLTIQGFLSGATTIDNVDGDLTTSVMHNAPGQFPLGVTTVTFSVTDGAGNTGTAQSNGDGG